MRLCSRRDLWRRNCEFSYEIFTNNWIYKKRIVPKCQQLIYLFDNFLTNNAYCPSTFNALLTIHLISMAKFSFLLTFDAFSALHMTLLLPPNDSLLSLKSLATFYTFYNSTIFAPHIIIFTSNISNSNCTCFFSPRNWVMYLKSPTIFFTT